MAYTGKNFNERIKQIGFVIVLALLFCLIIYELKYFLSSLLGAFTLYILLRKPYNRLLSKGWKHLWAVALLLISTILILAVFGGAISGAVYIKLKDFQPQVILDGIRLVHDYIIEKWGYNIFSDDIIQKGINQLGVLLPGLLSSTGNVIANVITMIFILFFLLKDSLIFEKSINNFLPVSENSIKLLKKEINNMVISNTIGIPVIMLGQGSVAAIAFWITGAGDPIIWGLLTGFFGLIPIVGTSVIWIPLAINLLIGGHIWQGIFLLIWGVGIISCIDNVIRIVFLQKYANVHPLTAFLGVILGINLFGFWGIIFGPLVISGFLLLIKIFKKEFLTE
jgi:predicted PurR-regulated permease PerM